jgi:hypothetical protein
MVIFLESPWPILLIGIAVEAVLAVLLWRTGQGRLLWTMLGVLGVVVVGWLVQWLVVTDREAIDNLLHDGAAAVEVNDINRVLRHISPSAKQVQADARLVLERVEVTKVRLIDLAIAVDRRAKPRVAKATFTAIGLGRDRKGEFPTANYGCQVIANLRREDGHWFVTDYRLEDLKLPGSRGAKDERRGTGD